MSVQVKTPSPSHFEQQRSSFGHQASLPAGPSTSINQERQRKKDGFIPPHKNTKKRRSSDATHIVPQKRGRSYSYNPKGRKTFRAQDLKFHLGGNINDPLNLNSLNDAAISAIHNAVTPKSSPLPTPTRAKVQIMIPKNFNDPLNLNSGEDLELEPLMSPSNRRKKKHNRKRKVTDLASTSTDSAVAGADVMSPLKLEIPCDEKPSGALTDEPSTTDKIVSPAIQQTSPLKWKRKRTVSEGSVPRTSIKSLLLTPQLPTGDNYSQKVKTSPCKPKPKKQPAFQPPKPRGGNKNAKYIHGNYDRYYGKRLPDSEVEDDRLQCFRRDWFEDKEILDIGCNIGHITLSIARDFGPKKIVGMDIDGRLISIARKNIRHYISRDNLQKMDKEFPISMEINYGPLAEPPLLVASDSSTFPNNVSFVQANYVLGSDDMVEMQREEYDCVMALSITKWVHLNNGDSGIKRFFKRIFNHLRPGGKFILEPQSWSSYKRKKKLTPKIFENYKNIRFRPDHFSAYLVSPEVGFINCDMVETPMNKYKGFQRPIWVFTKPDTSYATPHEMFESRGVTPLMEIHCQPHYDMLRTTPTARYTPGGYTPSRYTPSGYTPSRYTPTGNTPSYNMWSANATPRMDSNPNTPRGYSSLQNTPHQYGSSPAASSFHHQPYPQHKYTFISGDPRGLGGGYMASPLEDSPIEEETHESQLSPVEGREEGNTRDIEEMEHGESSPEFHSLQESDSSQRDREMTDSSQRDRDETDGSQREKEVTDSSPIDREMTDSSPTGKEIDSSPREETDSSPKEETGGSAKEEMERDGEQGELSALDSNSAQPELSSLDANTEGAIPGEVDSQDLDTPCSSTELASAGVDTALPSTVVDSTDMQENVAKSSSMQNCDEAEGAEGRSAETD